MKKRKSETNWQLNYLKQVLNVIENKDWMMMYIAITWTGINPPTYYLSMIFSLQSEKNLKENRNKKQVEVNHFIVTFNRSFTNPMAK